MYDVAVVGSGVGGLTAAVLLAKEGLRVVVLEQHSRIGGLMQCFERAGETFSPGVHFIGNLAEGQILWRYLKYAGVLDRVTFTELDPEGFEEYRFPDFTFRVPRGHEAFEARLLEHFPREARAVRQFVADMRRSCEHFPLYNLRPVSEDLTDQSDLQPLQGYLDRLTQDEKLKTILSARNSFYSVRPGECPLYLHLLFLDSFVQGSWQVEGGSQNLADAFGASLEEMGGEIRTSAKVVQIVCKDSTVQGVGLADGDFLAARKVIFTGHPKGLFALLPPRGLKPAFENRIMSLEETLSAFGIGAILQGDGTGLESRVFLAFDDRDVEGVYDRRLSGPHARAHTIFCAASASPRRDRTVLMLLTLMSFEEVARWKQTTVGRRPREYAELKESIASRMLDAARAKIPEMDGAIEVASTFTPLTFRDYTGAWEGSAYGVKKSLAQLRSSRILPKTRIQNLFLAGQNLVAPGVVGTVVGSVFTCCKILGGDYLVGKIARETG